MLLKIFKSNEKILLLYKAEIDLHKKYGRIMLFCFDFESHLRLWGILLLDHIHHVLYRSLKHVFYDVTKVAKIIVKRKENKKI